MNRESEESESVHGAKPPKIPLDSFTKKTNHLQCDTIIELPPTTRRIEVNTARNRSREEPVLQQLPRDGIEDLLDGHDEASHTTPCGCGGALDIIVRPRDMPLESITSADAAAHALDEHPNSDVRDDMLRQEVCATPRRRSVVHTSWQ